MPVDESDLQLTPDEARSAAEAAGAQLDADAIAELLSLTKSWPAAFAFALGVSTKTSDLKNIATVTKQTVYRYLAEQVFSNLVPADREFLMRTCLLPTLEPEVMIAGGITDARSALERLSQRTSFTSRESGDEYRYHDLFKDFLENEIRCQGTPVYIGRLVDAGRILEDGGRGAQALSIYLSGNLGSLVERLLLEQGHSLLDRGFIELVDRALALVWSDSARGQPILVALRAEIRSRMVQVDESIVLFGEALSNCGGDLYADIAQRFICVLLNNFRVNDAQAVALTIQLDAIENSGIRAIAKAVVATVHSISGREEESERLVKEAIALVAISDDKELEARILRLAAVVEFRNGHPERARFYAQNAMTMAEQLGLYDQAARACTTLMSASVDLPFSNARAAAALLMTYAEKAGARLTIVIALINLFSLAATRGDDEELRHLYDDLATLDPKGDPRLTETYVPANALWEAGQGHFDAAYDLLDRAFTRNLTPTWCAARAAELGLYAAASGNGPAAEQWIEMLAQILDENNLRERPLDIALPQLILALAHAVLGRPGFAQSALREARKARLWSRPGFGALAAAIDAYSSLGDRPDGPDRLAERLAKLTADGLGGYARIIEQLPAQHHGMLGSFAGLTKMETRVLRSLSEGASSKAIASDLGRSPQTVDTHVKSILRKLECNSRQQAVSVARRLGIV
jgi:ATP/maltotriose-dependent transcriptional regulator MalT